MLFFLLLVGVLSAWLAYRRGFSPWCWIFAAGIIGLVVVLFLPDANKQGSPEAQDNARRTGNMTGLVLTIITIVLNILVLANPGLR